MGIIIYVTILIYAITLVFVSLPSQSLAHQLLLLLLFLNLCCPFHKKCSLPFVEYSLPAYAQVVLCQCGIATSFLEWLQWCIRFLIKLIQLL
jgi:hypothetical protein